jgi:hypothetical protein
MEAQKEYQRERFTVSMSASLRYTIPRLRVTAVNNNTGNADVPRSFARACNEVGSVWNIPNLESIPYLYTTNSLAE